jgi:hypothetical protein
MAYTSANGTTTDAAATGDVVLVMDYFPGAQGAPQTRLDVLLRRAERVVRDLAPSPDPATTEYRAAARDAELAVFEFLFSRPSYLQQHKVIDESVTYADEQALEQLVRDAMPGYYAGSLGSEGAASVHNLRPEPLW